MFKRLRRAFKRADASVDSILADPLVQLRIALTSARGENARFGVDEMNAFIGHLLAATPAARQAGVEAELELVKQAVQTGAVPLEPDIAMPETQLLWAAALILIQKNPDAVEHAWLPQNKGKSLTDTPLWQALITAPRATEELVQHAFYVTEALRNPTARIRWGPPGSWFYFSPEENIINVDFMLSLIGGMEHTRSILFHEIGHSQLTVKFPDKMIALQKQIEEMKKTAGERKLSNDEYMKLRLLNAEWHLRMQLFDKTENDCVNRYTANMGLHLAQDYGYSLNHVTTTLSGFGAQAMRHDRGENKDAEPAPETDRRWHALMTAINLVFFKNNGYFAHTKSGWRRMGVDADYISAAPKISVNDNDADFPPGDFQRLMELCGGKEGLEHLQPAPRDRLYGRAWYNRLTDDFADRRNAIAEKIWDLYIAPFLPDLMKEVEKIVKEEMEKKKQDQQNQPGQDGQSGDPQQGQGEGSDGQEQDGQSQGQSGQKGQKGQAGQKGSQKDDKTGEKGEGRGDPETGDGKDGEATDKSADKDAEGQGKGKPGQVAREAAKSGVSGDDKVGVDGIGDMPDVDTQSGKPNDPPGQGNDKDSRNKGKDAAQADPGKTLDELMEEARKQQEKSKAKGKEKGKSQGDDGESEDSDSATPGKGAGSGGKPVTLDQLSGTDWSAYARIVENFMPFINLIARMMQKIRERQVEKVAKVSRSLEQLPQNNEIRRLDRDAHRNLIIKQKTGQDIEDSDLSRFRKDKTVEQPTTLDIVLMIDGSGSMDMKVGNTKVTGLQVAMASAIAIHEAAKRIDANVYICMWGNDDPLILAQPGDDHATISENITKAMKGLNSGTDLAPAVRKMVKTIAANREKGNAQSGYTHFMVLSDGDISDERNSKEMITRLFQASKYITMDFAIIKTGVNMYFGQQQRNDVTSMEKLAQSLQTSLPQQNIGVVTGREPEKLPLAIVGMLLEKMQSCRSFHAVPANVKKATMRRAAISMEMK